MTHKERFVKTLKCEPIGGQVPTFELVFYLTMEAFGKLHHEHRRYYQWNQMSYAEQKLHMEDVAQLYVDIAKRYGHSAIFVQGEAHSLTHNHPDNYRWLLELIREKCEKQMNDQPFIMMHGDQDKMAPHAEAKAFSEKFDIPFITIEGTDHFMFKPPYALEEVAKEAVKFFTKEQ